MTDPSPSINALRSSHDRLAALIEPLTRDQLTSRAYPSEWSIAQVLSHLGSGAEIMGLVLDSALAGTQAPGRDQYGPIWDEWNAKDPQAQARDGVASDRRFVERLAALDPAQRTDLRMTMFIGETDVDGMVRLRLNEHAVHTWDVAVALDPSATIGAEAVDFVVDGMERIVGWTGKAHGLDATVHIITDSPSREFRLALADPVVLAPASGGAPGDAQLRLPAEALVRLVYGRLDPDHTPPLTLTGIDLDDLRAAFPGL